MASLEEAEMSQSMGLGRIISQHLQYVKFSSWLSYLVQHIHGVEINLLKGRSSGGMDKAVM